MCVAVTSLCQRRVRTTVVMLRRARGKAANSENLEIAYACFVMVLEPFPPTTYHGQESARGGHTGSYSKAMFDISRIVDELEKNSATVVR